MFCSKNLDEFLVKGCPFYRIKIFHASNKYSLGGSCVRGTAIGTVHIAKTKQNILCYLNVQKQMVSNRH